MVVVWSERDSGQEGTTFFFLFVQQLISILFFFPLFQFVSLFVFLVSFFAVLLLIYMYQGASSVFVLTHI